MVERHHGGIGPLEELWHPEQLAKDVAGKPLVDGMLLCRASGPVLPACRQHSLHGWPLVCAFWRGREERQFLSALCFFISSSGGEEAVRIHAAIAMILKSRAHTATHKFRRRGCYGSTSFTKLHDAQMTVHT